MPFIVPWSTVLFFRCCCSFTSKKGKVDDGNKNSKTKRKRKGVKVFLSRQQSNLRPVLLLQTMPSQVRVRPSVRPHPSVGTTGWVSPRNFRIKVLTRLTMLQVAFFEKSKVYLLADALPAAVSSLAGDVNTSSQGCADPRGITLLPAALLRPPPLARPTVAPDEAIKPK